MVILSQFNEYGVYEVCSYRDQKVKLEETSNILGVSSYIGCKLAFEHVLETCSS